MKAFDVVWHDGLRQVIKDYIADNLWTEVIRSLYDVATSAVLLNGNVRDCFGITVGVRQGQVYP